jgi:ribosomal protein S18 acetylase RimI-like enzyme
MIRNFANEDSDAVAALWRSTWMATHAGMPEPEPVFHWKERLEEECRQGRKIFVCELRTVIVAFMIIDPASAHITQLFVDARCQGQGIGRALLDFMKERFPAGWSLNVLLENRKAIAIYERYGLTRGRPSLSPVSRRERLEFRWKPQPTEGG